MSLRDRQKADRERRILGAAVHLFSTRDYRAVRLEDLAARAGVSVGTVYNYYETKGDILVAVVAMEVEEVLATGRGIVDSPPEGAGRALDELIGHYYDHSLSYLSKPMWRQAMALSIEAPETAHGQRYAELDRRLAAQVAELFVRLRDRGELRGGLDIPAIAEMVFNNLNMMFIEFVKDDAMTLPQLRKAVSRQMRPLVELISTEAR